MSWTYSLTLYEDYRCGFKDLGFDMKIKEFDSIDQCTFLKGMWYRVQGPLEYYWGPLPSRILKMGKSLKHPKNIYGKVSFEQGASLFLNDMAQSYGSFLQVPLIRQFVKNFAKHSPRVNLLEAWKVKAAKVSKPALHPEAWDQICNRYGLEKSDFLRVESLYPKQPFTYIFDELFNRLNLVDYA
jgi:hypothetical protein